MSLVDDPNSASGKRLDYVRNLTYAEYNRMLQERDVKIELLQAALTETNSLLGCIITAWPSKEMLPKVEKQYDENLVTLR